ncbi:hypothetical protein M0805_000013 [Coniferiporia weirii]|nr:hypothetical protein M0805_000013 [Coniferiporia weirii]
MASALSCTFIGGATHRCIRMDALSASNELLFIQITLPPSDKGHSSDVQHALAVMYRIPFSHFKVSGAFYDGDPFAKNEVIHGEHVFVKWARHKDKQRATALAREASFYSNELLSLQGRIVPRFYGYYVSAELTSARHCSGKDRFSISVFEQCSGEAFSGKAGGVSVDFDYDEYRRQYMVAACALHASGIRHKQLAHFYPDYSDSIGHALSLGLGLTTHQKGGVNTDLDRHVIPVAAQHTPMGTGIRSLGVRIVDFVEAERHDCRGAPLKIQASKGDGENKEDEEYCEELVHLETVIGSRRHNRGYGMDRAVGKLDKGMLPLLLSL